jgi:hypothetical protein
VSATIYTEYAMDTTVLYGVLGNMASVQAERDFEEADERLEEWLAERKAMWRLAGR